MEDLRRTHGSAALVLLCCLALLATACSERGVLAPPTLEPLVVTVDGAWFRDAKRRVVLLRGANFSTLEREREPERTRAPREEDFAWLASLGFNLIRLPVAWASVEPRPSKYDHGFLHDQVDVLLRMASNHGMQVVLALHQIRWSSCILGGSGAPTWTCAAAESGADKQPAWGPAGVVADVRAARAQCGFFRDGIAPDGRTLREHYTETWRTLARYYEQDKRIAGFDLLNEPSPSSCFAAESFTADVLAPYYAELRREVRAAGAPQALVYQPSITRGSALAGAAATMGPGAVFAPHLYTQAFGMPADTSAEHDRLAADYEHAQSLARAVGGPLLIGEIGANAAPDGSYRPVTRDFVRASFDELDRRLIGGAVWAFVPQGEEIPASGGLGIGNESDAGVLARPFARRIAGLPVAMRFDTSSRAFSFTFRDDPAAAPSDPTEIFLPARRIYPHGYEVEVTPGDRWTFDELNQRLLLYRGAAPEHTVRITALDAADAGTR